MTCSRGSIILEFLNDSLDPNMQIVEFIKLTKFFRLVNIQQLAPPIVSNMNLKSCQAPYRICYNFYQNRRAAANLYASLPKNWPIIKYLTPVCLNRTLINWKRCSPIRSWTDLKHPVFYCIMPPTDRLDLHFRRLDMKKRLEMSVSILTTLQKTNRKN